MAAMKDTKTPGTGTREKILEAALDLFRERGFEDATMREIAARAGVATGLAYYYFASKDAIVLAFYHRAKDDLAPLIDAVQTDRKLAARLQAIIEIKFKYFKPNRAFLGALMAHAANPASPLSPFGETSRVVREFDFALFQRAITETGTFVPQDLAPHLAKILWIYQMGLLLFWIYDRSPDQRHARELLEKSLALVVMLIRVSNVPLLRPVRKSVLHIVSILER
ncbi:MAG: TetR family transcriptional regulator [Acidobacteriota bacterium]